MSTASQRGLCLMEHVLHSCMAAALHILAMWPLSRRGPILTRPLPARWMRM